MFRWIINRFPWLDKKEKSNNKSCQCYDKCTAAVALNHEEIGKDSGRISKVKLFIDGYSWKHINYS